MLNNQITNTLYKKRFRKPNKNETFFLFIFYHLKMHYLDVWGHILYITNINNLFQKNKQKYKKVPTFLPTPHIT